AARQPHADAAGNADLSAVHPAADRTRRSGHSGDAWKPFDANPARDARRHHENPRALAQLRHRNARDPRNGHVPSGISVAIAILQAHGLARFARNRESSLQPAIILMQPRRYASMSTPRRPL